MRRRMQLALLLRSEVLPRLLIHCSTEGFDPRSCVVPTNPVAFSEM